MKLYRIGRRDRASAVLWGATLTALALLGAGPAEAGGTLYFSDIFNPTFSDGWIRSVSTDGTGLQTLINTGGGLRGVAVDRSAGKLYWTNVDSDKIRRANLDGSNPEDLVTDGLAFPIAIALRPPADRLYWGDQTLDQIGSAELDGSNAGPLLSTPFHSGLAVDPVNGKLYWSTSITAIEGEILRANLDGTNVETVVTGASKPSRIALHVAAGKIYWTDFVLDVVRRADLDGSNIEDLYVVGANLNPGGIALDLAEGKIYWGQAVSTSPHVGKIMRMNLNGTSPEDVITGNFGLIGDIAFVPYCPGDVDGDGDTDLSDLGALLAAYGTSVGHPRYNPNADFDNDGDIDLSDLATLLADYGCGT